MYLGKDVPVQAGKMLEAVISAATPKIMTWGQYAEATVNIMGRKVLGRSKFCACLDPGGGVEVSWVRGMQRGCGSGLGDAVWVEMGLTGTFRMCICSSVGGSRLVEAQPPCNGPPQASPGLHRSLPLKTEAAT